MDLSTLETLVVQNNDLLCSLYALLLFVVGLTSAILVLFLLYKFIKLFF